MASISTNESINPVSITKFLGLNLSDTGDHQIKDGESGNMINFYITDDYKLRKIFGYKQLLKLDTSIQGIYETNMNGVNYVLYATNGHLYAVQSEYFTNEELWEEMSPTDLGTLTDDETTFFSFDEKVYVMNGHEYKVWDGEIFKDVEGYIPKVMISTKPDGSGTLYEQINLLTGKKHQTFNGDGTTKEYQLTEKQISSVDKVIVNTVELENDKYSVDLVNGKVTFNEAPSEAMDNVDIYWSKTNNDRYFIENMRASILFGGGVDTRVFLYGNRNEQNRIRYSAVADLVPSVEYFPGVNQIDIGADNFAVTDLRRHYDRLLVTTNKPDAYYIALSTLDVDGQTTLSPETFPLNEVHGNVAFNQGQVIDNDPVTIDPNAIIRWKSTNVRDERNMKDISQRIKLDLVKENLSYCKTVDFQSKNQLWIGIGNKVYIYNYYNDTFSYLNLAHEIKQLFVVSENLFMITETGEIMKFGEEYQTFNGTTIKAHWEMNFSDFKAPYLRKTMNKLWVLMQPQADSSAEIGYITNRNELITKKKISYKLTILDNVDFSDFSFQVSNNPQPFRLKMKAKKFTNLKIVIENNEDTDSTILALTLKVEYGGESK